MFNEIADTIEAKLGARIANLTPNRRLLPEEVDAITKYIIVTDELQHEPFMSQDNREGMSYIGESKIMFARLGHPAFLKSAILPFRKLWMPSEPCHFERIRDIIFEIFQENNCLGNGIIGYKNLYYEDHANKLKEPVRREIHTPKIQTIRDLIDIWINTHAVHTGRTQKMGRFDLKDFDDALNQAGRALFECEFRLALRMVGYNSYIHFLNALAKPAFERLLNLGYDPSFEAKAALKFGIYPGTHENVHLEDPFWHLDKESEEETFDRLIQRQDFDQFSSFFSGYYFARRPALAALKKYSTLDDLLLQTHAVILDAPSHDYQVRSVFPTRGNFNWNGGKVVVYKDKTIYFGGNSRSSLGHFFTKFRSTFYAERANVPQRFNSWDRDWWGSP